MDYRQIISKNCAVVEKTGKNKIGSDYSWEIAINCVINDGEGWVQDETGGSQIKHNRTGQKVF